ncbi:MAG TPA: ABC transporter permease [Crenalkalicoccus sp.]|nr:ABC transporter permease [Crenalkalicoccus sp.]
MPLHITPQASGLRLVATGRLDAAAAAEAWPDAVRSTAHAAALELDLTGLESLDTAGAVLLLRLEQAVPEARWRGPDDPVLRDVLDRTRRSLGPGRPAEAPHLPWVALIGEAAVEQAESVAGQVGFLGETVVSGAGTLRHPSRLRFGELMRHLDEAGLRAVPLGLLLGVLIGLILAFQSSIPLRQFGAEIFVPNLVGISLLRELGPLIAAVILAGRTGSAYAAELGTMVVNEEVDALRVMGIEPVAWLVLPRILAAALVMPVLTLVLDLAGLIGMGGVMATLGFPPVAVLHQLQGALKVKDLVGGLVKAAVFGLAIGLVGCRAGLGAGRGPRAVGDAATAAVVGGIVGIVVLDGLFAVLFFRLGL